MIDNNYARHRRVTSRNAYLYVLQRLLSLPLSLSFSLSFSLACSFAFPLAVYHFGRYFETERTYLPAYNDLGAAGKANFQCASPFRALPRYKVG